MKPKLKAVAPSAMSKQKVQVERRKRDPKLLDKLLDVAVADSMAASDPPTISNSEVKPK